MLLVLVQEILIKVFYLLVVAVLMNMVLLLDQMLEIIIKVLKVLLLDKPLVKLVKVILDKDIRHQGIQQTVVVVL